MQIDSHQHFWQYSSADYGWITDELAPLQNDFMPADLASLMESVKISGTIAVQARQQQTENRFSSPTGQFIRLDQRGGGLD